jgi:microcin C transport system substrate-binding protein
MKGWMASGLLVLMSSLVGAQTFPGPDWKDMRDPIASDDAVKGGSITIWGHSYPKSLNYFLDVSTTSADLFPLLYSSLMGMNSLESSLEPLLAKSWTISEDRKTFTLHLDPAARWSDGKPITAHDVKWSYDAIMNPANLTGPLKVSMQRFEVPEVLDDLTIQFTAKEVHWRNLMTLSGIFVLPKHAMEGQDFNKINFEFPVVSGPYRIKELKEGFSLTLERRKDWWRIGKKAVERKYNFDEIKLRFVEKREDAYAMFQKGQTDLHPVYTSRIWVKESDGNAFDKNWILKKKVFNKQPANLQAYVVNLRNPIFQDIRVRKALAMLDDRERMNETLMYSQYVMHKSYYEDIYDAAHPNPHKGVPFDPEGAAKLLDEAGWKVNPAHGYREKDGKRFSFRFLSRDPSEDKFLNIFDEALKDAGIEMIRDRKDWAAWAKDMDEFNFEMTIGAWRGVLFKDPETMWHSSEAERKAGQNYSGFKNEKVDAIIDRFRYEYDLKKRQEMLREIDAILVAESPYLLEWYAGYTRLLYWNKFGMPDTILDKFSDEGCIYQYWWFDEDRAEELEEAMEAGITLPSEPVNIHFEERFQK